MTILRQTGIDGTWVWGDPLSRGMRVVRGASPAMGLGGWWDDLKASGDGILDILDPRPSIAGGVGHVPQTVTFAELTNRSRAWLEEHDPEKLREIDAAVARSRAEVAARAAAGRSSLLKIALLVGVGLAGLLIVRKAFR